MHDRTVVADVIAGDADGFGAAYDQYAASLYAYCRSMLPEGEAAEAVLDTFLIAAAKLDGLADPGRLGAWLQAVARNECLRRQGPSGASGASGDEFAAATLPAGLRGKVLAACTDNTPAGRARRASAGHRAGAFNQAGFPRAIGPSGPRWWRRLQRHPGLASLAGLLVPLVVAAGVAAMLAAGGGSHRAAAAVRSGPDISAPVSSAVPSQTHPAAPARQVTATANATPPPTASVPADASSPAAPTGGGTPSSPSQPPSSPSPSPSPSPSSSPGRGYLLVAPGQLSLTSTAGTPVSGSFVLNAVNGPVPQYTVRVAGYASQVSVSPAGGSLPAGGIVTVTVTVTSKVALTTQVTVAPNSVSVTVVYTPKPKPKPKPSPTPTSKGGGG